MRTPSPGESCSTRAIAAAWRCSASTGRGYRAWCQGYAISSNCRDLDIAYGWRAGFPGARQSGIGYFSTTDTYGPCLDEATKRAVYDGVDRDGGSLEDRARKVYVWNTRPDNMGYYTEKWNEFLAA